MKTIQLNKSTIELPSCWEDLSFKEKIFTFGILAELFAGAISPDIARLKMLIEYTGYKPSIIQLIRESFSRSDQREIINFNLLKLSEELNFAFFIDGDQIVFNHLFYTNPIPFIRIGKNRYPGRRFERSITIKTDITAREFSDCFDLLSGQQSLTSDADRGECVNQICAILYPKSSDYRQNQVCGHNRRMRLLAPAIKFGIIFWFTGIVKFYTEHPVYSVLFKRNKKQDSSAEDKISLGMNEITLALQKEGYGSADAMNLNDYFDAQVKYLKDIINKSLAEGVKPEKLSEKSGIPMDVINKLA